MRVVAFSGGVGGAKLSYGLMKALKPGELTVIVNTGDDFEHYGLWISPDLDTVLYTLADKSSVETGWGLANETWNVLDSLGQLGGPTWFNLGDRDLATHLERTRRLKAGETLSQVAQYLCFHWDIPAAVIPMTDDHVFTRVDTVEMGELPFQEYFVKYQCEPRVKGFRFSGIDTAKPAPGAIEALAAADYIIICPSNPWVSIGPILGMSVIREAVSRKRAIAVSPIIGGRAIKGPAAKMYHELDITPSAKAVAHHYGKVIKGFVLDNVDSEQGKEISDWSIISLVTNIIMNTPAERVRLAGEILEFCQTLP
jgi:LPPG:FO 2-phospho-L-lactate transferase